MEKSTRLYGKRIVTIALIAVFVAMFAWITALAFITRAPAYADDEVLCSYCGVNTASEGKTYCDQCRTEALYHFDVDTEPYMSGNFVYVGNGASPSFKLKFDGSVTDYNNLGFWYGVSKTDDVTTVDRWISLSEEYDKTSGEVIIHLTEKLNGDAVGGIIDEYMFFRGGDNSDENEVYVRPGSEHVCLDINNDTNVYKITSLNATYSYGGTLTEYNFSTSQPTWVSSRVTFTVANNDGASDNAKFYYQLEGYDPVQFKPITQGGKYYGQAVIPSEDGIDPATGKKIDSYSGKVTIYSTDYAGAYKFYYTGDVYLNYDAKTPTFAVEATVPSGDGTKPYENNSWSSTNVTYKITPDAVASGATYSYYTDNPSELQNLNEGDGCFTYTATETGSVTFVAKSGSGMSNSTTAYTVKIDKTAPELNVKAVDANEIEIVSRGATAGAGKRAEYASNQINFTLSNNNPEQKDGNTVTYSYATEKDGNYTQVQSTNNNYVLSVVARDGRIVGRTYYFRAETASGLVSEKEFTVTILTSNFYTDMVINDGDDLVANSRGWLKDEIEIDFTMPAILAIDGEYRIVRYITGDLSTKEDCTNILSVTRDGGYVKYKIGIDISLDNKSVSFEIVDKANNVVSVKTDDKQEPVLDESGAQQPLSTGLLKLDLQDPQGVISAVINGSTISLTEDDWSKSEVSLYITPDLDASISGIYCYPITSGGLPSLTGLELVNGVFSTVVAESGVYSFRLESGAGRHTDLSFRVNIDDAQIVLTDVIAETESKDGSQIAELTLDLEEKNGIKYYKVNGAIANNVRVKFNTNQNDNPHYVLKYAEYTGSQINESAYQPYSPTSGDPYSFLIEMPEAGGRGQYSYQFKLVSKAQDSNGVTTSTGSVVFVVDYDVRYFKIGVTTSASSGWSGANLNFELYLENTGETVEVDKYQVKFGINGTWQTIEGTLTGENYGLDYEFAGLVNRVDGIDTDSDDKHMSYNGEIYFRALNKAGHASDEVKPLVKMDTSTPNPLYAIVIQLLGDKEQQGEMIYDDEKGYYNIYSKHAVLYKQTDSGSGVFQNKAPLTYYYRSVISGEANENSSSIEGNTWVTLGTEAVELEPGTYWIYAKNSAGSVNTQATKIVIQQEKTEPTAVITEAGNKSADEHIWEFNWTSTANVYISVTSETAVYFWYQPQSTEEWILVSDEAIIPEGNVINNKMITFAGTSSGASSSDGFTIIGDTRETYKFKITNRSGWEVVLDDSVIVKIDTQSPDFDFEISTPSETDISKEDLAGKWYPEAVTVKLKSVHENPSGIVYTYRVDAVNGKPSGIENFEYMRGTSLSTDDIVAFTGGNGTVTVTIRAQSNASAANIREETLTFNIDKVIPEFELIGDAVKDGATVATIASGEWTNADEVAIKKSKVADSKSTVTYSWWNEKTPSVITIWEKDTNITIKEEAAVYVKAESESGLVVTKKFDVKIDNVAPIINAGKITNSEDPSRPNRYYIDQSITWVEHNLKSAKYNNYPLTNGQVLSTSNVDNSNGGLVHIVIEDYAGNKAELTFYMTVFDLTVNTITLSDDDKNLLDSFEQDYLEAKSTLDESRSQYFSTLIGRLKDRLAMLQKQIDEYQGYLTQVSKRVSFDLVSDYENMKKYIDYFISEDPLVRYPDWQQEEITKGIYASYYQKLLKEYQELDVEMEEVRALQKEVIALPATNVVEKTDYEDVIRVYNKYESLSNDQKSVFKPTLYNKLAELKRLCGIYRMQDDATEVKIDGDSLGSMDDLGWLDVTVISSSSEKFKQAQESLYSSYGTGEPTKIISIHQLTMEGHGSVFDTGDITITIPIASVGEIDYASDYVYFGVYRLESDGSIVPVSGMRIAPDGKSVSFPSTGLGTYILATAGNVIPRPADTKVYGSIAGIEIDATILTYITFAVIGMFVIFVVVMVIIAVRRNRFLRSYNRDHKNSLVRRGITRIPKGNPPPASNPARPEERVGHEGAVYYKNRRRR